MRLFLLSLLMVIGIDISAQTSLQYQAHVPFRTDMVEFSAYIADSSFNEGSHINTSAFWYVEGLNTPVNNGIINVVLNNVPDSVFEGRVENLFVYGYVNGQTLGRLPVYPVPYARFSNKANTATFATSAEFADSAYESRYSDTSKYAYNAWFASRSDSSVHSVNADEAQLADFAVLAQLADRSIRADTAIVSVTSLHSKLSDTATYAHTSGTSQLALSVVPDGVTLSALDGHFTAPVGSFLTRGTSGIVWSVNPQYYASPTDVVIVTTAPVVFPSARWVVSRVAVNYTIVAPVTPTVGQLVTITNGSTSNKVNINATLWSLDTGASYQILPGKSNTLYFDGTNWITIQ